MLCDCEIKIFIIENTKLPINFPFFTVVFYLLCTCVSKCGCTFLYLCLPISYFYILDFLHC